MFRRLLTVVFGAVVLATAVTGAHAQGLFEFLFGGWQSEPRSAPPSTYGSAGHRHRSVLRPVRRGGAAWPEPGRFAASGSAFCVRLCDGRYFPVEERATVSAAQLCHAFCPASRTRVFYGDSIEEAVAEDGRRYAEIKTAFLYRERLMPDCTCTGKDSIGLAPIDPKQDPTLERGDVIATPSGLVAYAGPGRGRRDEARFTPVGRYPEFSRAIREKLAIMPVAGAD